MAGDLSGANLIPDMLAFGPNRAWTAWFGHLVQPGTAIETNNILTGELVPHGWRPDDPSPPTVHDAGVKTQFPIHASTPYLVTDNLILPGPGDRRLSVPPSSTSGLLPADSPELRTDAPNLHLRYLHAAAPPACWLQRQPDLDVPRHGRTGRAAGQELWWCGSRHTFTIRTHRPSHGAPTQAARRTAVFEGSSDG